MITCAVTGKTHEGDKLPAGWKKIGEACYSPEAVGQNFITRTQAMPVAHVEVEGEALDYTAAWKRFREALSVSWRENTQIANWALAALAAADNEPLIKTEKGWRLPAAPKLALIQKDYQHRRDSTGLGASIDSQSAYAMLRRVQARYRQVRFDLRIRGAVTLPTYRYPTPLIVPASTCAIDGLVVTVRLAGTRFCLRLRGGPEFGRQIAAINQAQRGEGRFGDLAIYQRTTEGSHRNEGKKGSRVFLAIATLIPRKSSAVQEGRVLEIQTQADRLWSLSGENAAWSCNEDQVKGWIAAQARQRLRLGEDLKQERRIPRSERTGIDQRMERLSRKYQARMNDWVEKVTAMAAGLAQRQRAQTVRYDDTNQAFAGIPWFKLRTRLEQKLAGFGIKFVHANACDPARASEVHESPEPPAAL